MRRVLPLTLLAGLLGLAYGMGWHEALSWPALSARRAVLQAGVEARPVLAALAYVGVYAAAVGVSIPGAVVITVTGGLLFGAVAGGVLAVTGGTIGAVLLFLAVRSALGPALAGRALAGRALAGRAGPWLDRLRPELERDGFNVLLALRLIPVVPFWLVNLLPALVGMRLAPFAAATFLGIIPGTAVFASVGAGLGHVLDAGGTPDLSVVLSAPVLLPLLGLAALSLLPPLWTRWKARHG